MNKKCPWCQIKTKLAVISETKGDSFQFQCQECGSCGPIGLSQVEALDYWNTHSAHSNTVQRKKSINRWSTGSAPHYLYINMSSGEWVRYDDIREYLDFEFEEEQCQGK